MRSVHPRRGFALITAMLILLVLSLLAVSMLRSTGLQERIAGNTRDKQRSFQAAQSALQYAETWLSQKNWSTGTNCTGVETAPAMRVCSNVLADPAGTATSGWTVRTDYNPNPSSMTAVTGGGIAANGDINYQALPSLYISYLGQSTDHTLLLFQINAVGYGGDASTVTVLQSIYAVTQ